MKTETIRMKTWESRYLKSFDFLFGDSPPSNVSKAEENSPLIYTSSGYLIAMARSINRSTTAVIDDLARAYNFIISKSSISIILFIALPQTDCCHSSLHVGLLVSL